MNKTNPFTEALKSNGSHPHVTHVLRTVLDTARGKLRRSGETSSHVFLVNIEQGEHSQLPFINCCRSHLSGLLDYLIQELSEEHLAVITLNECLKSELCTHTDYATLKEKKKDPCCVESMGIYVNIYTRGHAWGEFHPYIKVKNDYMWLPSEKQTALWLPNERLWNG